MPSATLPLVLVVATMLLQVTGVSAPLIGHGWVRFDPMRWPVEQNNQCIKELVELNRNSPEKLRIFNDLNFGGFLIFHAPRLRVFIDDRCALYGSEFLQAYARARGEGRSQLDDWQKQYGFRYALVETGKQFDGHLEKANAWTPLRRTPVATLYQYRVIP